MKIRGLRIWNVALCAVLSLLVVGIVHAQPAAAQTNGDEPSDEDKAIHYSLYYENFKNANYQDALPDLVWILDNAPGYPRNNDTNFERAVVLYDSLAARSDDPTQARSYLDSALVIYNTAVPTLQDVDAEVDAFIWMRNKGRFIQQNLEQLQDREDEAYEAYLAMYEMDPVRTDPYYIGVIINNYLRNRAYGDALDLMNAITEQRGDEEKIQQIVENAKGFIDPEDLREFLEGQIAADPDNAELRLEALEVYNELELEDEALETVEVLTGMVEANPDAFEQKTKVDLYRQALDAYVQASQVAEAKAAFNKLEALGAEIKAQDYYNFGVIEQQANRFGSAKTYFDRALAADSDFTKARQAIPNLYATAASTCAPTDREGKAVWWLVSDAYARAGMNSQAATYLNYGPNKEDIFYTSKWTQGGTTSVSFSCNGLNISGTTTVRASN